MKVELKPASEYNLDAMTPSELWNLWETIDQRLISSARILFPGQTKGIIAAARDFKNYCSNKATAMVFRMDGDIPQALKHEGICDRIYQDLPKWAKGW